VAAVFAAVSLALFVERGVAAPKPGVSDAVDRTVHVRSVHYALHVRIRKEGLQTALLVRGQADSHTISVHLAGEGTSGAELVDGSFLYERAPKGITVNGGVRWLRTAIAQLPPHSRTLEIVHSLTPKPLLDMVGQAHLHGSHAGLVYRGDAAYDDPVVEAGLVDLTGGIEFHALRMTVTVGNDGYVHDLLVTGHTADRSTTFMLAARLFGFGRPVHVVPPRPGTFMDEQLEQLAD
jgi:hypothetical protein